MDNRFYKAVEANPVIASVKDMKGLEECCGIKDIRVIFILFGDICSLKGIIKKIKDANKIAMVHIDLITGLSSKEVSVDFIRQNTDADGIISTKPALIKRGKDLGMFTILRYFLLDSMSLEIIKQQEYMVKPDFIEVLPGVMPKIIKKICRASKVPIIAGGLITDKESVMGALSAGVIAVSTTNHDVWKM